MERLPQSLTWFHAMDRLLKEDHRPPGDDDPIASQIRQRQRQQWCHGLRQQLHRMHVLGMAHGDLASDPHTILVSRHGAAIDEWVEGVTPG
jgi:hypothetical protein